MIETKNASSDSAVTLLVPEDDVDEPELSIVIPALNEELTVGEFVDWCKEGLRKARGGRRDPDRGQLRRRDHRDRALARRARPEDAAAWARARVHRRHSLHPRTVGLDGGRGLHVRLPGARPVRRALPRGERVRDGLALARLDRAWFDAVPPPVPRDPGDDLDSQQALLQQVLGHPLRHARDHARRAAADADPIAVVAVRVGDGPQGGAHGLADCRGSGPLPEGQGGQAQPPQARRLDRAVEGRLDQPAGDVRLRGRLLRAQAGLHPPRRSACCSRCRSASGR